MSAVILPTSFDGTNSYTLRVDLGDREFVLDFNFNQRESFWYFTLLDSQNVVIVAGVKVVLGGPLLRAVRDVRRPVGDLYAIDQGANQVEAGLKDLGDRVVLVYDDTQRAA
jgi:hypothetical protein